MDESELLEQFTREIVALEDSGAGMPFVFKPSEAFMLLSALQLALRHPGCDPTKSEVGALAHTLGHKIEERLCKTPAMQEVARRGWHKEYDTPR